MPLDLAVERLGGIMLKGEYMHDVGHRFSVAQINRLVHGNVKLSKAFHGLIVRPEIYPVIGVGIPRSAVAAGSFWGNYNKRVFPDIILFFAKNKVGRGLDYEHQPAAHAVWPVHNKVRPVAVIVAYCSDIQTAHPRI